MFTRSLSANSHFVGACSAVTRILSGMTESQALAGSSTLRPLAIQEIRLTEQADLTDRIEVIVHWPNWLRKRAQAITSCSQAGAGRHLTPLAEASVL